MYWCTNFVKFFRLATLVTHPFLANIYIIKYLRVLNNFNQFQQTHPFQANKYIIVYLRILYNFTKVKNPINRYDKNCTMSTDEKFKLPNAIQYRYCIRFCQILEYFLRNMLFYCNAPLYIELGSWNKFYFSLIPCSQVFDYLVVEVSILLAVTLWIIQNIFQLKRKSISWRTLLFSKSVTVLAVKFLVVKSGQLRIRNRWA